MIRLAILPAAILAASAAPVPAQGTAPSIPGTAPPPTNPACPPEHAAMGHCTPRPAAPVPAPATDPACPPAHAAMGHCVSNTAPPSIARPQPASPSTDPNCPPEHAAMGHCTPNPADRPNITAKPQPPSPATDPACPPEHAAMGHCTPAAPPRASGPSASGTALPAGNAAPPPPPVDRAAALYYAPAAMAAADRAMRREHGGMAFSQILFNLAEYQVRRGRDGYRWDGEGWFGGDIDRLTVKTEGEGSFGRRIEAAEVQALYSRAVGPYFNLQAGIRQDLGAGARRTYATLGVEGLAPYWFDVEGALFLSNHGDLLGRVEAYYDQRLTQRLMLQPRLELNLAAQDVPESGIGAGLVNAELGLRLRYEIAREFAPYVGISWDRKAGDTARLARAGGERASEKAITLGIRTWF